MGDPGFGGFGANPQTDGLLAGSRFAGAASGVHDVGVPLLDIVDLQNYEGSKMCTKVCTFCALMVDALRTHLPLHYFP
jgi:hypothetical protein